ncbi:MAG: TonB-dependent receptor, partial [Rhodospirillaceae bacterium]|nr:TonB-dependent receptor [Rhodospirillaceae bacterium]
RAVAYSGFRVPTLNELYRPFRVGNDITEANPALTPERLYGGDLGVDGRLGSDLTVGVTYFHARLTDAVANITVRTAPGLDPVLGVFVPVGGVLRQRRNLGRIAADGIEAEATWRVSDALALTARYLFTDPTVRRSPDQPDLVGKRLAQVARHQGTLAVSWQPAARLTIDAQLRATSRQFDDDQNLRTLRGYVVSDLSLGFALIERAELFLAAENLFDRTIETGRSADGLISVGQRRQFAGGVRLAF